MRMEPSSRDASAAPTISHSPSSSEGSTRCSTPLESEEPSRPPTPFAGDKKSPVKGPDSDAHETSGGKDNDDSAEDDDAAEDDDKDAEDDGEEAEDDDDAEEDNDNAEEDNDNAEEDNDNAEEDNDNAEEDNDVEIKIIASEPTESPEDREAAKINSKVEPVMKDLRSLVGLDAVKKTFEDIVKRVKLERRMKIDIRGRRSHAVFQGNPGTGKTTVARLYAHLLHALGIIPSPKLVETSGAKLASGGPTAVMKIFDSEDSDLSNSYRMLRRRHRRLRSPPFDSDDDSSDDDGGGVLFVDEAYQLISSHTSNAGKQVLDIILTEMERKSARWVVIFAGYKDDLQALYAQNPGFESRFAGTFLFEDLTEPQLHSIMLSLIGNRFRGSCQIEGGPDGLYMRAAARRLSSGRDKRGFGNARSAENFMSKIWDRQAARLLQIDDRTPTDVELFYLSKEDLLGPSPSNIKSNSEAWAKLQALSGLHQIKQSMEDMLGIVEDNYDRELNGLKPFTLCLNRIFVGSPGTGKTTVAKLYGRILADLGFLSNGDVVVKNPSDFIGNAVGQSESNTKAILASTVGKVLVIDEAYMLDPGGLTQSRNTFKAAVLDLLVAEVQGNPGDDRCVILLGYESQISRMLQNGNPGLSGRFMADFPFRFLDYTMEELQDIMIRDLQERDISYSEGSIEAAMDILAMAKLSLHFSNGRQVKNLVSIAIENYQARKRRERQERGTGEGPGASTWMLDPEDFNPRLSPTWASSSVNQTCRAALSDRVSEAVIKQVENIIPNHQLTGRTSQKYLRNFPRFFVLKGPPGTGKTTVAKQIGVLFYNLGILRDPEIIERSAADLIGQHVGHTVPTTRSVLTDAFGRVLVLNDAHRLAAEGGYTKEAVEELIFSGQSLSGGMVIVLSGQTKAVDELMRRRPELGIIFRDQIIFDNLSPDECLTVLDNQLKLAGLTNPFSVSEDSSDKLKKAMGILSRLKGWRNAHDISQLSITMAFKVPFDRFRDEQLADLPEELAMQCVMDMFCTKMQGSGKVASQGRARDPVAHESARSDKAHNAASQAFQERTPEQENMKENQKENQKAHKQESKGKDRSRTLAEKLKELAPCENGYTFRRDGDGYVCEGGQHRISDAEIAALV